MKYSRTGNVSKQIICIIVAIAMIIQPITFAYATTLDDLQDILDEEEREKEEIEGQLNDAEDSHSSLSSKKDKLQAEINSLNEELALVSDNLLQLELEIKNVEDEIIIIQQNLAEARELEAWQYECMKKRMQFMYESGDTLFLETFFSIKSFSSLINFTEYMEEVAAYDQKLLAEYEATREYIESEDARLVSEKADLEMLELEAQKEQSRIAGIISETSASVQQYKDEMDEVEKEMLEIEDELAKKEESIEAIKAQIQKEIELSQAAANGQWRDISDIVFAEGDRYLLANLIYCEAGGESYQGQVAVGAVVINRLLSAKYPDTLTGVIYQTSQFSPVASGRLAYALSVNKATTSCYNAADEAMKGITNVGNCLYFRTPIDGLVGIQIGNHIFY